MALSLLFFSAKFNILYSVLLVQVTLSHLSKFKITSVGYIITWFLLIIFFVPKKDKRKDF